MFDSFVGAFFHFLQVGLTIFRMDAPQARQPNDGTEGGDWQPQRGDDAQHPTDGTDGGLNHVLEGEDDWPRGDNNAWQPNGEGGEDRPRGNNKDQQPRQGRENKHGNTEGRNVHLRGQDRPECIQARIQLIAGDLRTKSNPLAGVQRAQGLNPRIQMISLESHMENGPRHGTIIVAVLMSLILAGGEEKTQV